MNIKNILIVLILIALIGGTIYVFAKRDLESSKSDLLNLNNEISGTVSDDVKNEETNIEKPSISTSDYDPATEFSILNMTIEEAVIAASNKTENQSDKCEIRYDMAYWKGVKSMTIRDFLRSENNFFNSQHHDGIPPVQLNDSIIVPLPCYIGANTATVIVISQKKGDAGLGVVQFKNPLAERKVTETCFNCGLKTEGDYTAAISSFSKLYNRCDGAYQDTYQFVPAGYFELIKKEVVKSCDANDEQIWTTAYSKY